MVFYKNRRRVLGTVSVNYVVNRDYSDYFGSELGVHVWCMILHCLAWIGMWFGLGCGELCAWTETNSASFAQASPSRLSRSCRTSILFLGSRYSLSRPVLELSDKDSRLGESGSPKRGRDQNLYHFERDFSSRREVLSSELWTLSPKRVHEVELMHFSSNPRPSEVCVLF